MPSQQHDTLPLVATASAIPTQSQPYQPTYSRKCQTPAATPAEPGELSYRLRTPRRVGAGGGPITRSWWRMAKQESRFSRRKATGREHSDAPGRVKKPYPEVALEIGTPICDDAIRGLLDDWLVPMIVDAIIKELVS